MSLVLDASATLAWVLIEETTPAIRRIFEQIGREGAVVPSIWRLEVANALEMSMRRGRFDAEFRDAALADLALLDIVADGETERHAWKATLQLATRHRLSVYDASYLELARRRGLPLASLDGPLRSAASAEGVVLMGQ